MEKRSSSNTHYKAILGKPKVVPGFSTNAKTTKVVTLGQSELQRITASLGKEPLMAMDRKKRLAQEKENDKGRANLIKTQMKTIDAAKIAKEEALLKETGSNTKLASELASKIEHLTKEQIDEVKLMNRMMQDARCVMVVKGQLEDNENIRKQKITEEKKLDHMMELERLKKIKEEEENEQRRYEEEKKSRAFIIDQIQSNNIKRLKKADEQSKEAQEMLLHVKQMQLEEQNSNMDKRYRQKEALDEILKSNKDSTTYKQNLIEMDRQDDEKIMKYLKEKAAKEEEMFKEQQRIRDLKEKEVALLREKQEKAMDRKGELDQLRAKRARQKEERVAREKEIQELEIQKQRNEELNVARRHQAQEGQQRMYEQVLEDKKEFEQIVELQQQARMQDLMLEEEKERQKQQYKLELKKQMQENEIRQKQMRAEELEEGKKVRHKVENEKRIVREKQKEKAELLLKEGIDDKFTSKIKSKKFVN